MLVEGGGEVHAYLLEQRLADELVLYIAPKVVGGPAKSWVGGKGLASIAAARPRSCSTTSRSRWVAICG